MLNALLELHLLPLLLLLQVFQAIVEVVLRLQVLGLEVFYVLLALGEPVRKDAELLLVACSLFLGFLALEREVRIQALAFGAFELEFLEKFRV